MSHAQTYDRLQLPEELQRQLHEFRRRVWSIKMVEAACTAAFGVMVAYLAMFAIDRVWETPGSVRTALFVAAILVCTAVPLALHRWVWNNRRLEQLARLLARKHPRIGDQLLGIIELVRSESEQARSRALCQAAIEQVADDARHRDFRDAVPTPRHRLWSGLLAVPTVAAIGLYLAVPQAASNAWARFLSPWRDTPRYTFAAIDSLPDRLVVAHGEPFSLAVPLQEGSLWRPRAGTARLGTQQPITAALRLGGYHFDVPAQIAPGRLEIHVGDAVRRIRVEPMLRPELSAVVADVALPQYLGRPEPQQKDVRGGAITVVKGSRASIAATATRALASAQVNGKDRSPTGATIASAALVVERPGKLEFRWKDTFGLAGREPFKLAITARDDEAPSLSVEDLPRHKVVLDSEQLAFKVHASDDFGVRRVGLEWQGAGRTSLEKPTAGEKVLAAGGNDKDALELNGTFSAKALGIEPQPINVRVFVEDYFPGRGRVYSPPYLLYVLTPEQHAIWLTEQLSKWHRQALEVRDREMQLHETNKQLRELTNEELDRPEARRRVENQAAAERSNGRRLKGLVGSGEDLVRQAMRNPEFGVGHLERWAEMLQILKDIAGNRMPSVADLLNQAARAPSVASNTPSNRAPMAGQLRAGGSGKPSESTKAEEKKPTAVPSIVDRESSQLSPDKDSGQSPPKKSNSAPRLSLPVTSLGGGKSSDKPPPEPRKMDQAVEQQRDLLAEFEKIADELNRVLANLEGSTLVKRLKAASRVQYKIAGRIGDQVGDTFGLARSRVKPDPTKVLTELGNEEAKGSHTVSLIMDDMQAYFERRRFMQFKTVLDDMKKVDVVGSLRQLGDELQTEHGISIAQCEFWSDTLDRWAEDLVDPSSCGTCPGSKSRQSLPPSVVLEVLQILEAEVNLREETRVAEQARPALAVPEYGKQAGKLAETQRGIGERVTKVTTRIRELPDGEQEFAPEIALLEKVGSVMDEAREILAQPETGAPAIAAETEAIELLLRSKRINPKGGGGGGSSPGGGGGGTTQDSALALLGGGVNEKEVREDRGVAQATGDSGPTLPEEFRAGLDEYFNKLERRPAAR